jgi:2-polyprenyl-3-methyl-5-hydroxy-6-metoxy-1,4-benzoquinol methylase
MSGNSHSRNRLSCPACLAEDVELWKHRSPQALKECRRCGLLFAGRRFSEEELEKLYSQTFYDSWGGEGEEKLVSVQKKAHFERHLRRIERVSPSGTLLDLGCARGDFLVLARSRGYDAFGVEISRYAAEAAANKIGGDHVRAGTLEESGFPPGHFSVVTMFDFLEHVVDLESTMAATASVLRDGGHLYIVTPDTSSLSFRVMGRHWWHFKEEHLWYFGARSLSALLRRFGFKILSAGSSHKTLSVSYALSQLAAYPKPFLTAAARVSARLLPEILCRRLVTLPAGELRLLAQKEA